MPYKSTMRQKAALEQCANILKAQRHGWAPGNLDGLKGLGGSGFRVQGNAKFLSRSLTFLASSAPFLPVAASRWPSHSAKAPCSHQTDVTIYR